MFNCLATYSYVSSTLDTVSYDCEPILINSDAFAPFVMFFGMVLFLAGFLILQSFLKRK